LPANSPPNEPPPTIAVGDPAAASGDPDLTTSDRRVAGDPGAPPGDSALSPAEQLTAERTERRRQRAAAHEEPTRKAGRLKGSTESTSATTPRRMTFRDSVSITLIAVLAAGGVLGAILGALSVTGWVIGLLVAGLTIVLSTMLRRYSRLT
jgi:hypothetical protein